MHFNQCRFLFFNQQCTIENKKFYHDLPLCRKFELYKKMYDIYFLKILDIYLFKKIISFRQKYKLQFAT